MGGLIIYHSFTLDRIFKNWSYFWKIIGNLLFIKFVKKYFVQHPAHFRLFLYVWAEKLMPHFQFSFESWLNNADLEWYIFFKSILRWLEKVSFQTAWYFSRPLIKLIFQHWAHFRTCLKVPEEKRMPHFQSSFKSWINNVDLELMVFLSK